MGQSERRKRDPDIFQLCSSRTVRERRQSGSQATQQPGLPAPDFTEVLLKTGENNIKAVAVKGPGKGNMKAAITDEISFNYQTEEWSNPKQLKLKTYPDKGSIVWGGSPTD